MGYLAANRAIDEFGELSYLEVNELIQVGYVDPVQLRGVDSGNEDLQILAWTLEFKYSNIQRR